MPPRTGNPVAYVDRNMHNFFLAPTSSNECRIIIFDFKNTSYEINRIPTRVFKHILE